MPITYRIDKARRIVFSEALGEINDADLFLHQDGLRQDPDFEPSLAQLFDTRGVTSIAVSTAAVRRLAKQTPFGAGARRAFIMPADEVYGLGRIFQVLSEESGHDLQIFRDAAKARSRLGLDSGEP